jgi:hypothetical protein
MGDAFPTGVLRLGTDAEIGSHMDLSDATAKSVLRGAPFGRNAVAIDTETA